MIKTQNVPFPDQYQKATGILRAEIAKRRVTLSDLAMRMNRQGVEITPSNISTKLNRGKFSASFFLQVLDALDCDKIQINQ